MNDEKRNEIEEINSIVKEELQKEELMKEDLEDNDLKNEVLEDNNLNESYMNDKETVKETSKADGERFINNGLPDNDAQYRQYYVHTEKERKKGDLPGWAKFLIIFFAIILGIFVLFTGCTNKIEKSVKALNLDDIINAATGMTTTSTTTNNLDHDYIGVLHIDGQIDEDSTSQGYNHKFLLKKLDQMMKDEHNKGVILYINTPGGTVYGSDELYLKIKEYQEETGRPVYSSMQSQATSGGYYISAPCDKIICNRNCWTGSIGVTIGTMYDISGLLDKYGIKTQTITAGKNKAMGSSVTGLTDEQKDILQSLVDEAYEQFTGIVAEGRDMKLSDVKKLADGRVYTAKQALELGLVDEIGTYEEAIEMMKEDYKMDSDISVEDFVAPETTNIYSLLGITSELLNNKADSGIAKESDIEALLDLNGKFDISYMCEIQK